jgi:hypothetical protein
MLNFTQCAAWNSQIYVLLTVHLVKISVNNQLDAQFVIIYVYFYSVHVSDSYVPIIRKISPVRYAGLEEIQSCIPDGYLPTVTYTKCRIDTVNSPDDGHIAVQNV